MLTKEVCTSKRIQPRFIEPMQIALVRELPDGGQWTYEAKLDGSLNYACNYSTRFAGES
jgi:hypothetical protein